VDSITYAFLKNNQANLTGITIIVGIGFALNDISIMLSELQNSE